MTIFNTLGQLLINNAQAATTTAQPAAQQAGGSSFLIMTAALIFMMYFMIWRPQSKRTREARELLNSIKTGDEVATVSGLLGTIVNICDNYIRLKVNDKTEVMMQKAAVTTLLPKGTLKSL